MRIFSPRGHGYLDYLVVIGFLSAPEVLQLDDRPAMISYILSAVHLVLTVATNFPLGFARVIPFAIHAMIEFGVSIVLFAMPWLLGIADDARARGFFIGAGASVLVVFLITDYTRARKS